MIELKQSGEKLDPAVRWSLTDLALERPFTVWYVMVTRGSDMLAWADLRWPETIDHLTVAEFVARYADWWNNCYDVERYAQIDEERRATR